MAKKKVFVALSGGVDSSVAAALLKYGDARLPASRQGFDVYGVHIKMWSDPDIPCNFKEDRYDAMRAAAALDIPFQTWDFTKEYRRAVVEYMISEYAAGRTPNPDVMCNRRIKFGVFLNKALEAGADYIATGHYVKREIREQRLETSNNRTDKLATSLYSLVSARDTNKDQGYFLWTLTQKQLKHCLFPIGNYTKPEVRELARKFNLPTAEKPDSQGICFIGEINLRQFLKNYIPEHRGRVLTTAGKTVGEHSGVEFYTIGQREGIGIGGGPSPRSPWRSHATAEPGRSGLRPREGGIPYYVAEKDLKTNTLVVAEGPYDEKLFKKELIATDVNWISGEEPKFPLQCEARIRYRQPLQKCAVQIDQLGENDENVTISPNAVIHRAQRFNSLIITFDEPQRAVTPGQSIVFYHNNPFDPDQSREILGGAVIAGS